MTNETNTVSSDTITGHANHVEMTISGSPKKMSISVRVNYFYSSFTVFCDKDNSVFCESKYAFDGKKKIERPEDLWGLITGELEYMVSEYAIPGTLSVSDTPEILGEILEDLKSNVIKRHTFDYSYQIPAKSKKQDASKTR